MKRVLGILAIGIAAFGTWFAVKPAPEGWR